MTAAEPAGPVAGEGPIAVTFFFDPSCPWTWLTSRWLLAAAERRNVTVHLRGFSLALINVGRDIGPGRTAQYREGTRVLRVIESLLDEGREDDAAGFYTEFGRRHFCEDEDFGDDLLAAAGTSAGVPDALVRADDEALDALVRKAYEEVQPLVGPDVGSPTIRLDSTGNAIFGPIVTPAPKGEAGARVLDAVLTLLETPTFYELKRTREPGGPDFS